VKQPPRNHEAERAVIGAVILNNELFDQVAEQVEAEDFHNPTFQLVWRAIAALTEAGKPIDAATLTEALAPDLDLIGRPSDLVADCAAAVPAPLLAANQYAPMIRGNAILRRLAEYGERLQDDIWQGPERWSKDYLDEIIANAQYNLEQIIAKQSRPPVKDWRLVLREELWRIDQHQGVGIPTGFPMLDKFYGGFGKGELSFMAARTSQGKTQLAVNISINAGKGYERLTADDRRSEHHAYPTVFFTLEMTVANMTLRALAPEAQLNFFGARQRGYKPGEKAKALAAADGLVRLPLEILPGRGMTPRSLRIDCRRLKREIGLELVIVDYLGLVRGDQPERQRWLEMREVVLALKEIAGELDISMLALSQLNRETKDDEEPTLNMLRDTGASEEHADNVLLLWQRSPKIELDSWNRVALKIAKQRNGPSQIIVDMEFKPSTGQFRCA
jgi:replicative DNA helicase